MSDQIRRSTIAEEMRKVFTSIILSLWFVILWIAQAQSTQNSSRVTPAITTAAASARENLLRAGKRLFVEKCSSCHGERGDKPLKTGTPLSDRKLSEEKVASAVAGRLKGKPDEQKHAVTLYIMDFMTKE